eukprot:scaffold18758_cov31-Tisochrysis_lutea.AAC.5
MPRSGCSSPRRAAAGGRCADDWAAFCHGALQRHLLDWEVVREPRQLGAQVFVKLPKLTEAALRDKRLAVVRGEDCIRGVRPARLVEERGGSLDVEREGTRWPCLARRLGLAAHGVPPVERGERRGSEGGGSRGAERRREGEV